MIPPVLLFSFTMPSCFSFLQLCNIFQLTVRFNFTTDNHPCVSEVSSRSCSSPSSVFYLRRAIVGPYSPGKSSCILCAFDFLLRSSCLQGVLNRIRGLLRQRRLESNLKLRFGGGQNANARISHSLVTFSASVQPCSLSESTIWLDFFFSV